MSQQFSHSIEDLPDLYSIDQMFSYWRIWEHSELFQGLRAPWQALDRLADYLKQWADLNMDGKFHPPKDAPYHISGDVWIGPGTSIEPGAMIRGPVIIGANCQIRHGSYIRDHVIIGAESVIGHNAEVKGSVLMPQCEIAHLNYVGDSVLGRRVHLGAGAILSNVRQDRQNIQIKLRQEDGSSLAWDTGRWKVGSMLGDGVEIGCNAVLNPGRIGPAGWMVRPGKSV